MHAQHSIPAYSLEHIEILDALPRTKTCILSCTIPCNNEQKVYAVICEWLTAQALTFTQHNSAQYCEFIISPSSLHKKAVQFIQYHTSLTDTDIVLHAGKKINLKLLATLFSHYCNIDDIIFRITKWQ